MKSLCIFIVFLLYSHVPNTGNIAILSQNTEFNAKIEEFSPEALKTYIIKKKLLHPDIVYAQAVWETGNFTSNVFKENNNLFGMKHVSKNGKRKTTSIGRNRKHAVYENWKKSVDDYVLWQEMFKKTPIKTEKEYYKMLGRIYATDPNYVKNIKQLINHENI